MVGTKLDCSCAGGFQVSRRRIGSYLVSHASMNPVFVKPHARVVSGRKELTVVWAWRNVGRTWHDQDSQPDHSYQLGQFSNIGTKSNTVPVLIVPRKRFRGL
eukprot:1844373-Rhodomonas_salina.3